MYGFIHGLLEFKRRSSDISVRGAFKLWLWDIKG